MSSLRAEAALPHVRYGHGARVMNGADRTYVDLATDAAAGTGHCHPRVAAAIRVQSELLLHAPPAVVATGPAERLAEALAAVTPAGLDACWLASSGGEAVAAALELARRGSGRPLTIAFRGSGRAPADAVLAPFPAAGAGVPPERALDAALASLDELLATEAPPGQVAALLVEPLLVDDGCIVPPDGFLRALRERCDRHGIALVADETRTGLLRTGPWFAVDREQVVPDVLVTADGLGSGLPIAALVTDAERMRAWNPPLRHGAASGSLICCAAASATLEALHELAPALDPLARRLHEGLARIAADSAHVAEARGRGLLGALAYGDGTAPGSAMAAAVVAHARERGVLLATCALAEHVVRVTPPLVVSDEQLDAALAVIAEATAAPREPAVALV